LSIFAAIYAFSLGILQRSMDVADYIVIGGDWDCLGCRAKKENRTDDRFPCGVLSGNTESVSFAPKNLPGFFPSEKVVKCHDTFSEPLLFSCL
jgi:hypothetical protein